MALYNRGQIVWAKVEKTATGGFKNRPVLLIRSWPFDGSFDYLAMMCSSSDQMDPYKFQFSNSDFVSGGFSSSDPNAGYIRPSYITTLREVDIVSVVGELDPVLLDKAFEVIRKLIG